MFKVRLFPLSEMDGAIGAESGVEAVPAAGVQTETPATPPVEPTSEPGAEQEVAAEPEKQNNFEKAFAKRLAAKEAEWEAKNAEKYKDYDVYKQATEYLQKSAGISDVMTLKEQLELADLQERAESQNLDPETLKRIEQLEVKAAKADELEQNQQEDQRVQSYFNTLGEFAKEKGVDKDQLNQFMIDNGLSYDPNDMQKSFNLAYKAMRADELEQKLTSAKEDGIKEYLASKQAPRVEGGNGAAGMQQVNTAKMSWEEIDRVAAERLRAANQPT